MSLLRQLSVLALYQVLGDRADSLMAFLAERLSDKSARLEQAMVRASEKAWNCLELALAGPTLLHSWQTVFSPRDEKTLQQNIQAFLSSIPHTDLPQDPARFCRSARAELHQARKLGLIPGDRASLADVALEHHRVLERCFEPMTYLERSQKVLSNLANELQKAGFTNLSVYVSLKPTGGQPLLVQLVHYFSRKEIEADAHLSSSLMLEKLARIDDTFRGSLDRLNHTLESQSAEFGILLSELGDTVSATHEGVRTVGQRVSETMELMSSTRDDVASLKRQLESQRIELQQLTALLRKMVDSAADVRQPRSLDEKTKPLDAVAAEKPSVSDSLDWSQVRILLEKAQQITQGEPHRRAEVSEVASRLAARAESFAATQQLVRELQAAASPALPITYSIPAEDWTSGLPERDAHLSQRSVQARLISPIFLEQGIDQGPSVDSNSGQSSSRNDALGHLSSDQTAREDIDAPKREEDRADRTNSISANPDRKRFLSPIFENFLEGNKVGSEQSE